MVFGGSLLISVGYTYNVRKFLYFIVTDDEGITKAGIPYLYNFPDPFSNITIYLLLIPLSCLSYLDLLIRLTPTTNQGSLL